MRKSLVLTVILASLVASLVTGCSQSSSPEANLTPPQATPAPSPATTPDSPFLTVAQPADGSIISVAEVEVRGSTNPGAVISVNDEIAMADAQGIFAVTIALEEGPNIIEVIASDAEGSEMTTSLTVTLVRGE